MILGMADRLSSNRPGGPDAKLRVHEGEQTPGLESGGVLGYTKSPMLLKW